MIKVSGKVESLREQFIELNPITNTRKNEKLDLILSIVKKARSFSRTGFVVFS